MFTTYINGHAHTCKCVLPKTIELVLGLTLNISSITIEI